MKKLCILSLILVSMTVGCSSSGSIETTTTTQATETTTPEITTHSTTETTTEVTTIITTTETTTIITTTTTTTEATTAAPVYSPQVADNDPDAQTVYIGKTGNKYHYQNCRTLKGKGIPVTLGEAKAQGRTSCGVCHR